MFEPGEVGNFLFTVPTWVYLIVQTNTIITDNFQHWDIAYGFHTQGKEFCEKVAHKSLKPIERNIFTLLKTIPAFRTKTSIQTEHHHNTKTF